MSRRRAKKKRNTPWKWVMYTTIVLLASAIGYVVYQGTGAYIALDNFDKSDGESKFEQFEDTVQKEPPKWEGRERVNILLLGGDARDSDKNGIARSDSIMVVSIDPQTKKAHLLSVLRDTYVTIPGHGKARINTAITTGGAKLAMETVGDLMGLDIQYFVYAEFEGFKAMIDAIGGVNFDVEKNMRYTDNADGNRYDIDLKKGYQLLDGDKALQYVRFRHDKLSDFTRTERQRNFLKAVATEMQSTWNLLRMKEILESVQPYIDTNLAVSDMLKLGQLGLSMHVAGSEQVPPLNLLYDAEIGGSSVLAVRDTQKVLEFVQETLQKDEMVAAENKPDDAGKSVEAAQ
ncbi:LytR family transcriptional regulator [Paenibacillaceae bacterium]|nr:LytR family transcriptional regulator [Paenibacillaceae bacterium]